MGDTVRYEDNKHIYHHNSERGCSEKVGEFRLASKLIRNDYITEDGTEKSEWAMSQNGHMWPLCDNHEEFNFNESYFGQQWECWLNHDAELTANWNRSDLEGLGIWKYKPSYDDETKSVLESSVSVSAPKGVSVSASVDFPKMKVNSNLFDHKHTCTYDFWGDYSAYDAATADVQLGEVISFSSLRPDSYDQITRTFMHGAFEGWSWVCMNQDSCYVHEDRVVEGDMTWTDWYEYDIDDL